MSFDMDEDILQDFLVEAGEILELLQEQLVELENNPDDANLLNAIFRGFHTVKGGAGFLSLTELVDACHGAENVFDILRTGKRRVTPELMDVILQSLDSINAMFVEVQNRQPLTPASQAILDALHYYSEPESSSAAPAPAVTKAAVEPAPAAVAKPAAEQAAAGDIDEITEEEFDRLMDELHGKKAAPGPAPAAVAAPVSATTGDKSAAGDDITDDEFEAILDQLHGKGSFIPDSVAKAEDKAAPAEKASSPASSGKADDEIDDAEFEALLDQLHGKGKAPVAVASNAATPPKPEPAAVPKAAAAAPTASTAPAAPVAADKAAAAQQAAQAETTVRVDTKRLDQIMNMVGELVLVRNRLVSLSGTVQNEEMSKAISNLDVVTADIQGAVMKTRMQPIKKVFGRFPRVVRDLARSLQKDIELVLEGEETDLDKNLVEALADPLVHLVRNSVDHGIEMPEVRQKAGKKRTGTVKLAAAQAGDHILLTIHDDGAGMDPEKLKGIAIKRGILDTDAAARMSDTEAFNLIFAPGFSTKEQISDISGRGVGMDVVKTKITQLNGTVHIHSKMGEGTLLEIKVPLTLAILPTLMVIVGKQTFALPLAGVSEIFHLDLNKTNVVDGQLTVVVRNKAIPLFFLEHWLVKGSDKKRRREQGHVVIVQIGTQQVGFVVDSLIGQEEVVIKPLDALLQGTPGMAGATITSDGGIALILDVPNLLKHYAKKSKIKFDRFNKMHA
ncbi:chemotaxis protein CheA [Rheinheimera nanhaiensis]|uniref:Chemotaxis protein CheA n=1 Tax=Rheinheimera nanhaiensis E407-8 TaxID=562729 RepID=I1DWG0_9GAMM|nr:chemotaxis protein CheA [Rheinheimera nanhaiensis]GAB58388.1 two-component system, chemotaxis family, sensor kinase CheA [Rheinheimera nanhaiensis E407-8]